MGSFDHDFGWAIANMKKGYKLSRKGWNGKGMWVIYVPGTPANRILTWLDGSAYDKAGVPTGIEILPHFDMYTINAEGRRAMLCGWLASQSDMDAEDWGIVE